MTTAPVGTLGVTPVPADPTTAPTSVGAEATNDGESRRFCGANPSTGLHTTWVVTPLLDGAGQVCRYRVEWSPGVVERDRWLYAAKVTTLLSVGEGVALIARISAL